MRWLLIITVIFLEILSISEIDLVIPSFPELQNALHLSPFWLESLLSINFIGYCVSLFILGSIADFYHRKKLLITGLSIFLLGSVFLLVNNQYSYLFLGRFLQGIGSAAPNILCFVIIADLYSLPQQQKIIAILNIVSTLGMALAPALGGFVTLYYGWRGNFVLLGLCGLLALFMVCAFIPAYKTPPSEAHKKSLWNVWQTYSKIFQYRIPGLSLLILNIAITWAPSFIFISIAPILYMQTFGLKLTEFMWYQGIGAFIFALSSFVLAPLMQRYTLRQILLSSAALCMITPIMVAVLIYGDTRSPLWITLSSLPYIIGMTLPSMSLYPLCLNLVPEAKGRISSLIQAIRLSLMAIGLEIIGYWYHDSFIIIGLIMLPLYILSLWTLVLVARHKDLMQKYQALKS